MKGDNKVRTNYIQKKEMDVKFRVNDGPEINGKMQLHEGVLNLSYKEEELAGGYCFPPNIRGKTLWTMHSGNTQRQFLISSEADCFNEGIWTVVSFSVIEQINASHQG